MYTRKLEEKVDRLSELLEEEKEHSNDFIKSKWPFCKQKVIITHWHYWEFQGHCIYAFDIVSSPTPEYILYSGYIAFPVYQEHIPHFSESESGHR